MSVYKLRFRHLNYPNSIKLLEIEQLKHKISFSCCADFEKFLVINFAKRQIVSNGHL